MTATSFNPPLRTLMGPGPSDIHPRVSQALSRPIIGHLDPEFIKLMDEMKSLLHYAFQTENALTLPVSGPGSVGMETCFVNLLEPGDTVIVCQNGVFGGRMKENVERCGATAVMVEDDWGTAISLDKVEAAFKANDNVRALAFVHAETSTGVQSDAAALCKLAKDNGALSIMDAVTSLGGTPVKLDEWGVDAAYSGSQKCLSCVPGLSPVSFSAKAVERITSRNTKIQSWFMDMNLVMGYWGQSNSGGARSYHHTAPINALYALHESLVMLQDEGLDSSHARHFKMHSALKAGLEAMGLSLLVNEADRLPQLNTVTLPEGIDEAAVRKRLLNEYGLEIGAGLGSLAGKVWRIGLMGASATPRHVTLCLAALDGVLTDMGAKINSGVAVEAAQKVLLSD